MNTLFLEFYENTTKLAVYQEGKINTCKPLIASNTGRISDYSNIFRKSLKVHHATAVVVDVLVALLQWTETFVVVLY